MKLKFYLHNAAKNSDNPNLKQVCFRLREDSADFRIRTELYADERYWSDKIPGYKKSSKLSTSTILRLNTQINEIAHILYNDYKPYCNGDWIREQIARYLHPEDFVEKDKESYITIGEKGSLVEGLLKYIERHPMSDGRKQNMRNVANKIRRFELWQRTIKGISDYALYVNTLTAAHILDFKDYIAKEHIYYKENKVFYAQFKFKKKCEPQQLTDNFVNNIIKNLKIYLNWTVKYGDNTNLDFKNVRFHKEVYTTPIYLTIEERDRLYYQDLSKHPRLVHFRNLFVFQCLIGCRIGDLYNLTRDNVKGKWLEYYPQKSKSHPYNNVVLVRVPLCEKALTILKKYEVPGDKTLIPMCNSAYYSIAIKHLLLICGIDRMVMARDLNTKEYTQIPLYEAATSHTARKTFIANLYKKVKDPNLIASMTGHVEGSRAFKRYREIDDGMKKELVDLID